MGTASTLSSTLFGRTRGAVLAVLFGHVGGQGNLWTEYIPNFKHAEYMVFPRLCALAEVTWSPPSSRNWEDFIRRLPTQCRRFDQLGVDYRKGTPERIGE